MTHIDPLHQVDNRPGRRARRRRPRALAAVLSTVLCAITLAAAPADAARGRSNTLNPQLYPVDARPFGKSMSTWLERATQWVYGTPLDQSPLFDPTGENCDVKQRGPVWYIARIAGPAVFEGTRYCTIPHQKSILLYIGAVVATYPCPADPSYQPAPGQSLYEFLASDADFYMDTVDHLEVTIDGVAVKRVLDDYRYVSDDLFSITGDPSLAGVLDPCITGEPQQAVVDGFFLMLKPLDRGEHTIVVHGTNTFGHDKTFTYHLTVV